MKDDDQRLIVYYEQSSQNYSREADFLFRRFNFFLTGMSFLVAALVIVLTASKTIYWLGYAIIILGGVLSLYFFMIDLSNSRNIKKMRDYIFKVEKRLGLVAGQSNEVEGLGPPLTTVFPNLAPDMVERCRAKRFHKSYPASHTWVIPFGFAVFWAVMSGYFFKCV